MMTSLDVAMTKIRKLEEENMELKISVKEAETKISLLEREEKKSKSKNCDHCWQPQKSHGLWQTGRFPEPLERTQFFFLVSHSTPTILFSK